MTRTELVQPGARAPDLEATDQDGKTVRLTQFRGQPVVLYFYPHDFTPVCTREACGFRNEFDKFERTGAIILGVSPNTPESHARFAQRHHLPFRLLSDTDGKIRAAYGVKSFLGLVAGRVTFVIDAQGIVVHRFRGQYHSRRHVDEALQALGRTAAQAPPPQPS